MVLVFTFNGIKKGTELKIHFLLFFEMNVYFGAEANHTKFNEDTYINLEPQENLAFI